MLTLRHLYFLWLIMHVTALIFSGWFSRITISNGVSWSELIGYSSKFWPIQTLSLSSYDITEFLIYYAVVPYLAYKLFERVFLFEKYR